MVMLPRSQQCCGNCGAGAADKALYNPVDNSQGIFCRFFPPQVVMVMEMQQVKPPPAEKELAPMYHSRFPSMHQKGWCYQWIEPTQEQLIKKPQ